MRHHFVREDAGSVGFVRHRFLEAPRLRPPGELTCDVGADAGAVDGHSEDGDECSASVAAATTSAFPDFGRPLLTPLLPMLSEFLEP